MRIAEYILYDSPIPKNHACQNQPLPIASARIIFVKPVGTTCADVALTKITGFLVSVPDNGARFE
jgi:hypothetical protein